MDMLLIICLFISFAFTFVLVGWWIGRAEKAGLMGIDMHKISRKRVAEIGGLPVFFGFVFGAMLYTGYRTFINGFTDFNVEILGVLATVSLVCIIGIVDDILGWKLGLRQYQKPILCLFAALPMVMTQIGNSRVVLPFAGELELGILYFVVVVPFAISGAANAFNMLAGYNGLEAGMGAIILSTLGFVAWQSEGLGKVAMLAGIMAACLLAFLFFNWYPSRVFPGDTLTYTVGSLIAAVSILGNTEKLALFLFVPYFIEFLLKARGRWKKESFSRIDRNGFLILPYKKVYGLGHLVVKIKNGLNSRVREKDVVVSLLGLELFLAVIVIAMYAS